MFKLLLTTELAANRQLLLFNATLNVFFLVLLGAMNSRPLVVFMFVTLLVYFVHLLIMTVSNSDQRRTRLYAQLPVTATQVFWAQWLFCLAWLAAQAVVWLLYGAMFDPDFSRASLADIGEVLLGTTLMLGLVSVAIDLFAYHPVYLRWLYLALAAIALGVAVRFEVHLGLVWNDNEIALQPFAQFGSAGMLFAAVLALLLITVDRHVFHYSENFLH